MTLTGRQVHALLGIAVLALVAATTDSVIFRAVAVLFAAGNGWDLGRGGGRPAAPDVTPRA